MQPVPPDSPAPSVELAARLAPHLLCSVHSDGKRKARPQFLVIPRLQGGTPSLPENAKNIIVASPKEPTAFSDSPRAPLPSMAMVTWVCSTVRG